MTYLRIISLNYHLLVDIRYVREVLDYSGTDGETVKEWCQWRDTVIQARDLRRMLGGVTPPAPHGALVYAEESHIRPLMLYCDELCGLISAEESEFCDVPGSAGLITGFVDRIVPDRYGKLLLFRLKKGFWQTETNVADAINVRMG